MYSRYNLYAEICEVADPFIKVLSARLECDLHSQRIFTVGRGDCAADEEVACFPWIGRLLALGRGGLRL